MRSSRCATTAPGVGDLLRATWEARRLVPLVGSRVLIKGYAGTKLGRAWLVLRPGVTVLSMTLLFGAVLGAPSNGVPYPIFLLTGLLAWLTFDRFVFWAVRSFDVYGRLIRNFAFPLLLVPTASGFAASVEFTIFVGFILIATCVFWAVDGVVYLQFGPELLLAVAGVLLCVCGGVEHRPVARAAQRALARRAHPHALRADAVDVRHARPLSPQRAAELARASSPSSTRWRRRSSSSRRA